MFSLIYLSSGANYQELSLIPPYKTILQPSSYLAAEFFKKAKNNYVCTGFHIIKCKLVLLFTYFQYQSVYF